MTMKALVAMSGGVDSSVAAYLLKRQGLEVAGLSFELWDERDRKRPEICCSLETIEIARDVARGLGIEHYTIDVRDAFYHYIIEEFCSSYRAGRTPNPCILCNQFIKFHFLLHKAEEIGAEYIATGHYARIEKTQGLSQDDAGQKSTTSGTGQVLERFLLKKGIDPKKDQSYVLYVMTQKELSRTLFPLGPMKKEQTRALAQQLGLASAVRPESQEICFIGEGSYVDFLRDFAPDMLKPGPILGVNGEKLGEHTGIAQYTIGQRKRLNIASLEPRYVVRIDHKKNAVVVGKREDAVKKSLKIKDLNWISISRLEKSMRVKIKIRSTMNEALGEIIPLNNQEVIVLFDEPQWAPAPGQSAVFYANDVVVGGGIIS